MALCCAITDRTSMQLVCLLASDVLARQILHNLSARISVCAREWMAIQTMKLHIINNQQYPSHIYPSIIMIR